MEWVGRDELLELAYEGGVVSEFELGVDPVLLRGDPQLLEAGGFEPGEVLLVEVGERGSAPELEGFAEQPCFRGRLGVSGLLQQPFEAVAVDGVLRQGEPIAGRSRDKDVSPDQLPQRGDGVLERPGRRRRRALAPEVGDQPVGGDGLAGPQCQRGQERTLLPPRQRNDPVGAPQLERAEQADVHGRVVTPSTSKANAPNEWPVTVP